MYILCLESKKIDYKIVLKTFILYPYSSTKYVFVYFIHVHSVTSQKTTENIFF